MNVPGVKFCYDENDDAKDVAELILKFANSGLLKRCSKNETQNITKILYLCANSGQEAQTAVVKAIKTLVFDDMFKEYSKSELWKIIETLSLCVIDNGSDNQTEFANAIYGLAQNGSFEKYFKYDIKRIEGVLDGCANNDSVERAREELKKVIAMKR